MDVGDVHEPRDRDVRRAQRPMPHLLAAHNRNDAVGQVAHVSIRPARHPERVPQAQLLRERNLGHATRGKENRLECCVRVKLIKTVRPQVPLGIPALASQS